MCAPFQLKPPFLITHFCLTVAKKNIALFNMSDFQPFADLPRILEGPVGNEYSKRGDYHF